MSASGDELVGRDRECERVSAFLEAVGESGSVLLIRGEPGIGKTSLWRAGLARAGEAGIVVLSCRCFEADMQLPFAALLDLLEPAVADFGLLGEPQRAALQAALGLSLSPTVTPDRLAVARAVLDLLRALAARRPLVVAVDDVQWLDAASARVLAYLGRRLEGLPVGLFVTQRSTLAAPASAPPQPLFVGAEVAEIDLGPLSLGALGHLLRERTGRAPASARLRRLHAAVGGNPFYALEFSRVAGRGNGVPARLRELAEERIAALPGELKSLLELVAVAGAASTSALAAAHGDHVEVARLFELALDDGVFVIDRDIVSFSHPLLTAAVYEGLRPQRRRRLHRQLAAIVTGADRARHLASATVSADADVAAFLAEEAFALARRGAPDEAATLALHAQRLTPAEDAELRYRRGLQAARFLLDAGEVARAIATLDLLLAEADANASRPLRAETLIVRADAEWENRALLVKLLREAAASAGDEATRSRAELRLAWHEVVGGKLNRAAAMVARALEAAAAAGVPFLIEATTVLQAHIATIRGQPALLPPEQLPGDVEPMPPWHRTRMLAEGCHRLWAGDLVGARRLLLAERAELVRSGRLLRLPFTLLWLAELEWRAGRWTLAEHYAAEGTLIADEAGGNGRMIMGYLHALLAASRGEADAARELTREALSRAERQDDALARFRNGWILAELELSLEDPAAAWRQLDRLPEQLGNSGFHQPALFPILPTAVEAASRLGLLDEATRLAAQLETDAALTGSDWAAAAAAHAEAHVLLAAGRHADAARASEEAASRFERLGAPYDQARALLTLGRAAHASGSRRHARDTLSAARDRFGQLGATTWAERAELEASRISGRRGSRSELTEAEKRVAELVAQGLSNKEVAARLFTTVATVESHLTRIYRKCGLRSRAELARSASEGLLQLPRT